LPLRANFKNSSKGTFMQCNTQFITTIAVTTLMMTAVHPARSQESFINLVNANSKCLQPINNSTAAGDAMVLLPCDPKNTAQVWIQTTSSGKVHFVNFNSKLCLDARGAAAAGTPIQQWTCNAITNENWWNPGSYSGPLISAVSGTSNYCLIPTGDQDGATLQLTPCSSSVLTGEIWFRPAAPDPNPNPPTPVCGQPKSHPCP
jgi:Ricin-type beta-trefoil lectin domain